MKISAPVVILLTLALAACSNARKDDSPRIKSLQSHVVVVERNSDIEGGRDEALQGYRAFLDTPADPSLKIEALRRLGDMQMEAGDDRQSGADHDAATGDRHRRNGKATASGDFREAIRLYTDLLKVYPHRPGNDRVLYQLARAYEQIGDTDAALVALTRLVSGYPDTPYLDEAQFRRGELLFARRAYTDAEPAYQAVIAAGDASPYYEKALYMHGWTLFKQGRYEAGLDSFFPILDRKLAGRDTGSLLAEIPSLSRGDREVVDDTFRVISLSFTYLDGAEAVARYFDRVGARAYEYRVYQNLGDLYMKQERVKDAADAYAAFTRRYPVNPQSPLFQVKVIDAYKQAGFTALELDAKKEFVVRYGVNSDFRKANDESAYRQVMPHLKRNLEDLARYYHASAQKSHASAEYREAARWYQEFLTSFPDDPQAPSMNFLLAEALFEDKRYGDAAIEYERAAYQYPVHAKSADAGYAALLAYAEQEKLLQGRELQVWHQRATESSLRFADRNPNDRRSASVLTRAAERLYADHSPERAALVAQRALASLDHFHADLKEAAGPKIDSRTDSDLRRTAWVVIANTQFESGAFQKAEASYQQALALTPPGDKNRTVLNERLAASVYKQGEQRRSVGDLRGAVSHFRRVGRVAPGSTIQANADYDAAASLIALKDWPAAIAVLENFRKAYPGNDLQADATVKLAAGYLETGQLSKAATEFETLAANKKDPQARREAMWQVAELHEKAGNQPAAGAAYRRYIKEFPLPLEPAVEARVRLAGMSGKSGQSRDQARWLQEIIDADRQGGRERTGRTRYLAAKAAMSLAEPYYEAYKKVRLVEPLKKSLKMKKEKMEAALKAYTSAAEYGVADVATVATYRVAEIYNDFSRSLMASQRPRNLSAMELEQYNVMLEEQAFPFEEKAIEIHEVNAERASKGIYDQWVKDSFAELGKLRPIRYSKPEKSEAVIDGIR